MIAKAEGAYEEAIETHGKMLIEEQWPTLDLNESTPLFDVADTPPEFPGGIGAFYQYVGQALRYPGEARKLGIEGRVFVQFIVNKDGSIDAVRVPKGIGSGCDEEAIRIVQNAPKFKPGMKEGEPAYVRMMLPIIFKLAGNEKSSQKKRKRG